MVDRALIYGGSLHMHSMHSLWIIHNVSYSEAITGSGYPTGKQLPPWTHRVDLLQLFNSNLRPALHC